MTFTMPMNAKLLTLLTLISGALAMEGAGRAAGPPPAPTREEARNLAATAAERRLAEAGAAALQRVGSASPALASLLEQAQEADTESGGITSLPRRSKHIGLMVSASEPRSASDSDETKLLWFFIEKGHIAAARSLINHSADAFALVNSRDPEFGVFSLLMRAASGADSDFVQILIDNKAEVNAVMSERNPMTPLLFAAATGKTENARILIAAGANVNYSDGERSALVFAANGNYQDLVQLLRDSGADPSLPVNENVAKILEEQKQKAKAFNDPFEEDRRRGEWRGQDWQEFQKMSVTEKVIAYFGRTGIPRHFRSQPHPQGPGMDVQATNVLVIGCTTCCKNCQRPGHFQDLTINIGHIAKLPDEEDSGSVADIQSAFGQDAASGELVEAVGSRTEGGFDLVITELLPPDVWRATPFWNGVYPIVKTGGYLLINNYGATTNDFQAIIAGTTLLPAGEGLTELINKELAHALKNATWMEEGDVLSDYFSVSHFNGPFSDEGSTAPPKHTQQESCLLLKKLPPYKEALAAKKAGAHA